uniref:Uncharacterized protein n=1 Tax=Timema cristinae TaxID=61476 RepID=A0A7R9DQF7_TIMCR|nr:unnamed protein product [Timema cristinae]
MTFPAQESGVSDVSGTSTKLLVASSPSLYPFLLSFVSVFPLVCVTPLSPLSERLFSNKYWHKNSIKTLLTGNQTRTHLGFLTSRAQSAVMDFDDVLDEIGDFGRYQITIYLLICLPVLFAAGNSLTYVFTAGVPDYRSLIE